MSKDTDKNKKLFTIAVPTYNDSKAIIGCLQAIIDNDFDKDKYSLLVIDDGSTDTTAKKVEDFLSTYHQYDFKLYKNPKNLGRALTRYKAAELSKTPNVLFVDTRAYLHKDFLQNLVEINYEPAMAVIITQDTHNFFARTENLIRRFTFRKNIKEELSTTSFVNDENFDEMPKGTTIFFTDKDRFLSTIDDQIISKHSSDDTKVLRKIVKEKPIMKSHQLLVNYEARTSMRNNIHHLHQRGPKFVDYYLDTSKKLFYPLFITYTSQLVAIIIAILSPADFGRFVLVPLAILILLLAFRLSERKSDFFKLLFGLPLVLTVFISGLDRGLLIKFKQFINAK